MSHWASAPSAPELPLQLPLQLQWSAACTNRRLKRRFVEVFSEDLGGRGST
jgi:hypothetical protein